MMRWRRGRELGFFMRGPTVHTVAHAARVWVQTSDREQTSQVLEPSSRLCRFPRIHVDAFPSRPRAAPPCGLYQAVPAHPVGQGSERAAWLHEIKHDGYRIIACKSGDQVRLWSRNGRDWSREFLAVAEALRALRADEMFSTARLWPTARTGCRTFRPRSEEGGAAACLFAFDLLRLNGEDLRPLPLEERRARLRKALRGAGKALRFSEHLEATARPSSATPARLGWRASSRSDGTPTTGQGGA